MANVGFWPKANIVSAAAALGICKMSAFGQKRTYQAPEIMITDILIASPSDASRLIASPAGDWPRVQFNSLDNMALAGLWAALGGEDKVADFEGEKHLLAHTDSSWVFEFPRDFIEKLAIVQLTSISEIAARWATHDELVHMGASGAAVEPIVAALQEFANKALSQDKTMLLFMAL